MVAKMSYFFVEIVVNSFLTLGASMCKSFKPKNMENTPHCRGQVLKINDHQRGPRG